MRRYNLAVLGISETHWTQAGQQSLDTGELLAYSGHEEENAPHTQGVALVLSKVTRNALVGWESHGSRIIKVSSFKTKEGIIINIIQCYALTDDSKDDIKDQFYGRLHSIIEKCPRKDLTILMGDLNAKLGIDNTGYEDIMGQHGLTGREKQKWRKIYKSVIKERKNEKTAINNSRTRAEKFQLQAEYIEANEQVKKSIRADRKKYVEELATTSEKAAREGNMKQLYDTTNKLAGKYSKPERLVKDKENEPITEIQQQRNRCIEYFEEILNRLAPLNPSDIDAANTDLPIDVNQPTTEETRMAIRQIKNGKAAGPDNIPAEALKSDIELSTSSSRCIGFFSLPLFRFPSGFQVGVWCMPRDACMNAVVCLPMLFCTSASDPPRSSMMLLFRHYALQVMNECNSLVATTTTTTTITKR
ncbi:unnamed protein product [Schistosoma curassoni]|uniref:Endo/exonuclease/phosphatase domain-containing protein n=1 Tax=Schistosoma curassoni TaxID=6186 RepID=A0A183K1B2_9TREM|nr:unnamed protein product [Schistosoma curassoni]